MEFLQPPSGVQLDGKQCGTPTAALDRQIRAQLSCIVIQPARRLVYAALCGFVSSGRRRAGSSAISHKDTTASSPSGADLCCFSVFFFLFFSFFFNKSINDVMPSGSGFTFKTNLQQRVSVTSISLYFLSFRPLPQPGVSSARPLRPPPHYFSLLHG